MCVFCNPDGILTWLETTDSPKKDQCVIETVEYLSLTEWLKEPAQKPLIDRLSRHQSKYHEVTIDQAVPNPGKAPVLRD